MELRDLFNAQLEVQAQRNAALLADSPLLGTTVRSEALPFQLDLAGRSTLSLEQDIILEALEIEAARTAVEALASLALIGESDHLGGGLEIIPALCRTLALVDFDAVEYTIEHAHVSIGYYAVLAAFGYIPHNTVVDRFRRGLETPGHVAWTPGGTQLNGGRLGVIVPAAVGQALGKRAIHGDAAWVICHCGDAGWISPQALSGFHTADYHNAPVTFVMHRNGIQLSGATAGIMRKDPRSIIAALGVEIIEVRSLHDRAEYYEAIHHARALAAGGRPALIYPLGSTDIDLRRFGEANGIEAEVEAFALANRIDAGRDLWIPGSLMSYRDVQPMLECIALVNGLPGGKHHHDGHMKGRSVLDVLENPMLQLDAAAERVLEELRRRSPAEVVQQARPRPGSPNLVLTPEILNEVKLPHAGDQTSARSGSRAAYELLARSFPENVFVVSCDLDPSTKLDAARKHLRPERQFELSIAEQTATLLANGLACAASDRPQLTVFSTFAAFFEGIAREGFEFWRYQRNLNGVNEGLNVVFHLSHVGANTGRDHFSGWGLDWINLAIGYMPYLRRFYAPCDARAAFVAVRDMASACGAHIIGIPRDSLPVLVDQQGRALWENTSPWNNLSWYREFEGARAAIIVIGAPAWTAGEAAEVLNATGTPCDVVIINALPLAAGELRGLVQRYPAGIVTVEDGLIGTPDSGLRGIAGMFAALRISDGNCVKCAHVGIVDPRIAPSDGYREVWEHFGITRPAIVKAVEALVADAG